MSYHTIQVAAARQALGLATSDELVRVANQLLDHGVYSLALGELVTTRYPIMAEVGPLFLSTLKELGISQPTESEAALCLAKQYIGGILEGRFGAQDGVLRFGRECLIPLNW